MLAPGLLQPLQRRLVVGLHLVRRQHQVARIETADPHPGHTVLQTIEHVLGPHVAIMMSGRIVRVAPHDGRQHERRRSHVLRQRPNRIEPHRQRRHARPAHQPDRGLRPDAAAQRRRNAHRAARVGTERARHQTAADGHPRSARRSARHAMHLRIPWIPGRPDRDVGAIAAEGILDRIDLAGDDGAGFAQLGNHEGIARFRRRALTRQRSAAADLARHMDDVLHGDRHAMQQIRVRRLAHQDARPAPAPRPMMPLQMRSANHCGARSSRAHP